jgi:hypothetical protein
VTGRIGDELGDDKSDAPATRMVEYQRGRDNQAQGRTPPLELRRHFGLAKPRQLVAKVSCFVGNGRRKAPYELRRVERDAQ